MAAAIVGTTVSGGILEVSPSTLDETPRGVRAGRRDGSEHSSARTPVEGASIRRGCCGLPLAGADRRRTRARRRFDGRLELGPGGRLRWPGPTTGEGLRPCERDQSHTGRQPPACSAASPGSGGHNLVRDAPDEGYQAERDPFGRTIGVTGWLGSGPLL